MISRNDIRRDLAAVAEQIANARAALTRDELVDIAEIPEKVRLVAGDITDLPPEDASELRPLLAELLEEFKRFSDEVRSKISAIQARTEPEARKKASGRSAT